MLTFTGFQDALNAVLVIIVISVVIALAWLSTNVREQPLIATAVVVFQSGASEGGDQNASVTESSRLDNQSGGGTGDGEGELLRSAAAAKGNESAVMEVTPPKTEESQDNCGSAEIRSVDSKVPEPILGVSEKNCGDVGAEALVLDHKDEVLCCGQDTSAGEDTTHHTSDSTDASKPSFTSSSEKLRHDELQEMAVRNRRLKHFVTMGGSLKSQILTEVDNTSLENDSQQDSSTIKGHDKESSPLRSSNDKESSPLLSSNDKESSHLLSLNDKESSPLLSSNDKESSPLLSLNDKESSPLQSLNEKESSPLLSLNEERPPGSIRIRLKFLDDTQKNVFAQLTEQVGTFKRQHFSIEMDANRRIRLIFNGMLLSQDSSTLAQYGLFDNCVVHCHVSQPQQMSQNSSQTTAVAAQEDEDDYVTNLLAPLLYCVLVVVWYLRYDYSHLFNTMSTVILLFLTALLLISTYLLYITQTVPGSDSAAQISSHHQLDTNSLL